MCLCTVKKSFCGCSLLAGSYLVALLTIISTLMTIVLLTIWKLSKPSEFNPTYWPHPGVTQTEATILIVINAVMFLDCYLLIFGLFRCKVKAVCTWTWVFFVYTGICFAFDILGVIKNKGEWKVHVTIGVAVAACAFLLFRFYCFILVHSLKMQLKRRRLSTQASGDSTSATATSTSRSS